MLTGVMKLIPISSWSRTWFVILQRYNSKYDSILTRKWGSQKTWDLIHYLLGKAPKATLVLKKASHCGQLSIKSSPVLWKYYEIICYVTRIFSRVKCRKNSKFAIVLFRPSPWEFNQKEIEIRLVFCVRYYLEGIEDLTQILTRKEIETRFKSVHRIIRAYFVNEVSWLWLALLITSAVRRPWWSSNY